VVLFSDHNEKMKIRAGWNEVRVAYLAQDDLALDRSG
jgi:hypothetical protein